MTVVESAPSAGAAIEGAGEPRADRWRRRRVVLVLTAAVLAAFVVALVVGGPLATSAALDPDNPGSGGARAVARVLEAQGVEVRVVRGAAALEREDLDADTTVVVTSADQLGESTTHRLVDSLAGADLVVTEPHPGIVVALGLDVESTTVVPGDDRPAGCSDPLFADLTVRVDVATEYATASGCFGGEHGHLVARPRGGLTLLGASSVLANDQVLRADNAAVALRLLGRHDRLVWYVPDAADLVADDGVSISSLLPDWVEPGLWVVGATVVALMLWRVRRLGPLVTEPLPVTVKAIETTRSRGRLYRKAGDRGHAAHALRESARTSLIARLHLPPSTDEATLVRQVARSTGRAVDHVHDLLSETGRVPAGDDDLISLANDLATLEREVRP